MNGILWAVVGTSIGVLGPVLFVLWRRRSPEEGDTLPTATAPRQATTPAAQARTQAKAHPAGGLKRQLARRFRGTSLKAGPHPCQMVQSLSGQRFLPEEAPALPLAGCDQQKCQCSYNHHGDRRDEDDRRAGWGGFGGFTPTVPGGNRRTKARERRAGSSKGQPASN